MEGKRGKSGRKAIILTKRVRLNTSYVLDTEMAPPSEQGG